MRKRAVSYLAENLWILFPIHLVTLCFFTYTNIHKLVTLGMFMKTIYIYTYICMVTYICTYISDYVYIWLCIYDYISLCMHTYMNIVFYVHMCIYIYDLTAVLRACAMSSLTTQNMSMTWNGMKLYWIGWSTTTEAVFRWLYI